MKKLAHFGWNTLFLGITVILCMLLFSVIPAYETVTSFGIFFMFISWALLYFSTYIIGYERKSTFLNIIAAIVNWIAIIIAGLGCLIVLIEHGSEFYRYAEAGIVFNPFLNGLCVMWPFVALFSISAYGLIQEERDYERGILRIPVASLIFGYLVALAFSFLGLLNDFFYTWFFLILMGIIIILLIILRDRLPDRLPFLALLCKEIKLPGKGGKKSKGGRSTSTYSATPTSSSASSGRSAQDIVSGLGRSSSSGSSASSTPSRSSGNTGTSSSAGSIKKPTSSGSSSNNIGGNLGKLK
jgi:hypothetical protein